MGDDIVYEVRQLAYDSGGASLRTWLEQLRADGYQVTDLGYTGRDADGRVGHIFEIKRPK